MLIVAIPKSASTALMETLATAHGMPCDMHYKWKGPQSDGFDKFSLQHPAFCCDLSDHDVEVLTARDVLYKTHVVPSNGNLSRLRDAKKVVLLRSAEGVIGAYRRGEETGVYKQKSDTFKGCRTESEWLDRAREAGLLQDLARYERRWRKAGGDQLLVEYDDLMNNTQAQITRIEAYFGLPSSNVSELLKRKYTRAGEASLPLHRQTVDKWKQVGRSNLPTR